MVIISGGSAVGSTRCPHIFGGRGANSRCVRRIAHTRARPVTDAAEFEGGAVFFSLFFRKAFRHPPDHEDEDEGHPFSDLRRCASTTVGIGTLLPP